MWISQNDQKWEEAVWEGKQQHLCSALNRYLLEPEGDPAIVPEREYKKGEEMRFYLCCCLKTRLFLIHLTQVAERSPQLLSFANLLILPKAPQRAHHKCMRGAHQHMATLFFFKFYWYLFIYTQSGTRNTFWKRPNMPLHVCMLKTFDFFIPINRIQGVQMGGYAPSWCASIRQTWTGKSWACNMCIYGCFWEVFS